MQVTGQIKVIRDTQKVSERFQKREFILATEANTPYPQYVEFQVTQDKVNSLDNLTIGQEVTVDFNLRGREWSGPQGVKYFNTLEAWRISQVGDKSAPSSAPVNTSSKPDDSSDLPFN